MHKLWKTLEKPHKPRVYKNLKDLKPFLLGLKISLKTKTREGVPDSGLSMLIELFFC
jgi:hypothetical protein